MRKIKQCIFHFEKISLSILTVLFVFFLSSCDMMNVAVMEFFEEGKALQVSGNSSDAIDTAEFDNLDPEVNLIYFVSFNEGDDDSNDGSKEKPLQTVDKALSLLKENFSSDTDKTAGYVLLLSDINITSEIKFETYNFAELAPHNVDITIAGYGAKRTINANSNCRVMSIAYAKGNINLKHLILAGGYNIKEDGSYDGVGGSGLYVSSTDCSGKKCLIYNCTIRDNMSTKPGAALAINTDYVVYIQNSIITNNLCYDGASACDFTYKSANPGLIISNTSITDNDTSIDSSVSYDFGYVINATGLLGYAKLDGGVIIQNNEINQVDSSSDYSKLCAVYSYAGSEISGKNIIRNNLVYLNGASSGFSRNIVLSTASTAATETTPKIFVKGDCTGSSIGVYLTSDITSAVAFTSGYSANGTTVKPGTIFISDCAYGIDWFDSDTKEEAAFVLSSGSFTDPLGYTMNFDISPSVIHEGSAKTITVTPTVTNASGSDITSEVLSKISWNLKLYANSVLVTSSSTNKLSLTAAQAVTDTYNLVITASLNGISYDGSSSIVCKNTLSGMISVSGATVSGAVADSGVFVTGRSVTIPNLYASDHELTQKEYLEYCYYGHSGNSKIPQSGYLGDNYPACFISWYDSIVYCNLRSIAEGLTPAYSLDGETDPRKWTGIVSGSGTDAGKYCGPLNITSDWDGEKIEFNTSANGWRMPTEAEWEYLARGADVTGTQTAYAGSDTCSDVAWTSANSTLPQLVKQKAPNTLGFYDMSGNVYEYVWDWYGGTINSSIGAKGYDEPCMTYKADGTTEDGYRRMVRGGAYNYGSNQAKISDRSVKNTPEMRWANCGVRIVRNAN